MAPGMSGPSKFCGLYSPGGKWPKTYSVSVSAGSVTEVPFIFFVFFFFESQLISIKIWGSHKLGTLYIILLFCSLLKVKAIK